ncbi:uncharacterized protein LOC113217577 [Frankliniella occidentalis]|uniref:Uncharacterized protein LOC113217577 n=1 Tax=Frankliniella occidentalis TaxID=133901 RepID=A0A6J1TJ65_FRAOC|nr:uncharacterized protein LOC113217577 [Frankliniella occidentalis]
MARVVLLLLTVTVALVAATNLASFDLATFKARFQKGTPYIASAVAHVKPFVSKINALQPVQRDRLTSCLYSAALNAKDMDNSEKAMIAEIGGCLNEWSDTEKSTMSIYNELSKKV